MRDRLIIEFDKMVKNLFNLPESSRDYPDANIPESELSEENKKMVIALMRVNHCGEVCAQGLYQGQALTSRNELNKEIFEAAAEEEEDHLAWTANRINTLGGKVSIFNPLFYLGSLTIGVVAGLIGDKWNLAFLHETECQVEQHLEGHLAKIPNEDLKSLAILEQMKIDERAHAQMAHNQGAAELPFFIKSLMKFSSKIMTKITYHI